MFKRASVAICGFFVLFGDEAVPDALDTTGAQVGHGRLDAAQRLPGHAELGRNSVEHATQQVVDLSSAKRWVFQHDLVRRLAVQVRLR